MSTYDAPVVGCGIAGLDLERGLSPRPLTRAGLEAGNRLFLGRLIAELLLRRRESRGSHYREDHPGGEGGRSRHSVISPGGPAADLPRTPLPEPV